MTVAANAVNFVTNAYAGTSFDATSNVDCYASGSVNCASYWTCNSNCGGKYCPNIALGYSGTSATWYTVANFPLVVSAPPPWRHAPPRAFRSSNRPRRRATPMSLHAPRPPSQSTTVGPNFCASTVQIIYSLDSNMCISGGPTASQPTWAQVQHTFNPVKATW